MKLTLREMRTEKELSVRQASRMSGIAESTIRYWEANGGGGASPSKTVKLLDVYGKKLEQLDFNRRGINRLLIKQLIEAFAELTDKTVQEVFRVFDESLVLSEDGEQYIELTLVTAKLGLGEDFAREAAGRKKRSTAVTASA